MLEVKIENILPITEVKSSLEKLVDTVGSSDEMFVVAVDGKPKAMLVGVHHMEALTGTSHKELMPDDEADEDVDEKVKAQAPTLDDVYSQYKEELKQDLPGANDSAAAPIEDSKLPNLAPGQASQIGAEDEEDEEKPLTNEELLALSLDQARKYGAEDAEDAEDTTDTAAAPTATTTAQGNVTPLDQDETPLPAQPTASPVMDTQTPAAPAGNSSPFTYNAPELNDAQSSVDKSADNDELTMNVAPPNPAMPPVSTGQFQTPAFGAQPSATPQAVPADELTSNNQFTTSTANQAGPAVAPAAAPVNNAQAGTPNNPVIYQ